MTRLLLAAALLAALPAPAGAGEADPDPATLALLARVEAASRAVDTLDGEIVQRNRVKLFKQELTSKGRFFFQRPRRVRWEYTSPDPSVLLLDGEVATLRAPGAPPQVFDLKADATMRAIFDQLLMWLGSGTLKAAAGDYRITSGGTAAAPSLTLVPITGRAVARAVARVELRFDRALLLSTILLREPSGDEKEIQFVGVRRNGKLPPDAFR